MASAPSEQYVGFAPENIDIASRIEAATKMQLFLLTEKYTKAESQAEKDIVVTDVKKLSEYIRKQSSKLVKVLEEDNLYFDSQRQAQRVIVDVQYLANTQPVFSTTFESQDAQTLIVQPIASYPVLVESRNFDDEGTAQQQQQIAIDDLVTPTKPRSGDCRISAAPPSTPFDRLLNKLLSPKRRFEGNSESDDSHLCNQDTSSADSYAVSSAEVSSSISVQLYPQLSETPIRPQRQHPQHQLQQQKGVRERLKAVRHANMTTPHQEPSSLLKTLPEVEVARVSFNLSRPVSPILKLPSSPSLNSHSDVVVVGGGVVPSIELGVELIGKEVVCDNVDLDAAAVDGVSKKHDLDLDDRALLISNDAAEASTMECKTPSRLITNNRRRGAAAATGNKEVDERDDDSFIRDDDSDSGCEEVFDLLESVGEWDSLKPFVQSYDGNPSMRISAIDAAFARETRGVADDLASVGERGAGVGDAGGGLTIEVDSSDDQLSAASEHSMSIDHRVGGIGGGSHSTGSTHTSQDVTHEAVLEYAKGDRMVQLHLSDHNHHMQQHQQQVEDDEDDIRGSTTIDTGTGTGTGTNALRVSDSSGEGSLLGSRFVQPRELDEIRRDGATLLLLSPPSLSLVGTTSSVVTTVAGGVVAGEHDYPASSSSSSSSSALAPAAMSDCYEDDSFELEESNSQGQIAIVKAGSGSATSLVAEEFGGSCEDEDKDNGSASCSFGGPMMSPDYYHETSETFPSGTMEISMRRWKDDDDCNYAVIATEELNIADSVDEERGGRVNRYAYLQSHESAFAAVEKKEKKGGNEHQSPPAVPARKVVNRQRYRSCEEIKRFLPASSSSTSPTTGPGIIGASIMGVVGRGRFPTMSARTSRRAVISRQNSGTLLSSPTATAPSTPDADSEPLPVHESVHASVREAVPASVRNDGVRSHSVVPVGRRLDLHSATTSIYGGGAGESMTANFSHDLDTGMAESTTTTPDGYALRSSQRVERRKGGTPFADRYVNAHKSDLEITSVNVSSVEVASDAFEDGTVSSLAAVPEEIRTQQQQLQSGVSLSVSSPPPHITSLPVPSSSSAAAVANMISSSTNTEAPAVSVSTISTTPTAVTTVDTVSHYKITPVTAGTTPAGVAGLWAHGMISSPPGSWGQVGKLPRKSPALSNKIDLRKSLSMAIIRKPSKTSPSSSPSFSPSSAADYSSTSTSTRPTEATSALRNHDVEV